MQIFNKEQYALKNVTQQKLFCIKTNYQDIRVKACVLCMNGNELFQHIMPYQNIMKCLRAMMAT